MYRIGYSDTPQLIAMGSSLSLTKANIEGIGWTVIDWKTSQKRKPTLSRCYDDPLQVAAYCSILGITNGCLVKDCSKCSESTSDFD